LFTAVAKQMMQSGMTLNQAVNAAIKATEGTNKAKAGDMPEGDDDVFQSEEVSSSALLLVGSLACTGRARS
jgi:hypothetical protein